MARLYNHFRTLSTQLRYSAVSFTCRQVTPSIDYVPLNVGGCRSLTWNRFITRPLHTSQIQSCKFRKRSLFDDDDDEDESFSRPNNSSRGRSGEVWDDRSRYGDRRGGGSFGRGRGGYRGGRDNTRSFYDEEVGSERRGGFDLDNFREGDFVDGPIDTSSLPSVKKDFFTPSPELVDRPAEENAQYLRAHNITVHGSMVAPPIQHFSDHEFPESFVHELKQFSAPTPIQAQGWSAALSGRDFIGVGQTGSGKTLGYLLPGLLHIAHHQQLYRDMNIGRRDAPLGLVMAPTRELVQQIMEVARHFGPGVGVKPVAMFGGASKDRQLSDLKRGNAQLVVATPGRLLDYIQTGEVNLGHCSFVVLDEADRMLDMGFEPQIRKIIHYTRPDRQTLMWSATWPEEIQELALDFLKQPVRLTVGSGDLRANPDITQVVHICDQAEKNHMLNDLVKEMLEADSRSQAIVFCETKRTVDRVAQTLYKNGVKVDCVHGDKSQRMRDSALNALRRGRLSVLVATDVAARGLDIPDLACVVNYDFPNDTESYVHRIGRTGRRGIKGTAHTFFTEMDASQARPLIKVMRDAGQEVSEQLQRLADDHRGGSGKRRGGFRNRQSRGYSGGGGRGGGYGRSEW